jgi:hypothetical protein
MVTCTHAHTEGVMQNGVNTTTTCSNTRSVEEGEEDLNSDSSEDGVVAADAWAMFLVLGLGVAYIVELGLLKKQQCESAICETTERERERAREREY